MSYNYVIIELTSNDLKIKIKILFNKLIMKNMLISLS